MVAVARSVKGLELIIRDNLKPWVFHFSNRQMDKQVFLMKKMLIRLCCYQIILVSKHFNLEGMIWILLNLETNGAKAGVYTKITLPLVIEWGMVIGITQPPPKEGAWSALLHSCPNPTSSAIFWRRLRDTNYCALF